MNTPKVSKSGRSKLPRLRESLQQTSYSSTSTRVTHVILRLRRQRKAAFAVRVSWLWRSGTGATWNWSVSWEDDWMIGSHVKEYGEDVYSTDRQIETLDGGV